DSKTNPNDQPSSNIPTSEESSPILSEPLPRPYNPLGTCPYNIVHLKEELAEASSRVLGHYVGNIHLNTDLSIKIDLAQRASEDPRCAEEARIQQLPQMVVSAQQALAIGQKNLERTMESVRKLQENMPSF
ncbi:hypothetical protein H6S82_08275, partial [Planktothrix sp. FACHB-1355]